MTNTPDRYIVKDTQGNVIGSHQYKSMSITHAKGHARRYADYHIYVLDTKTGEIVFQFGNQLPKALQFLLNPTD